MQTLGVMAIHRGAAGARFGLYTCCTGFDSPALHFSLYQIFWGIAMNKIRNTSKIITTPEQIVREFRVGSRGVRIEYVKEPISKLERVIWIFLIFAFGWLFGYLHHFLATVR